jgi:hypothetical protein
MEQKGKVDEKLTKRKDSWKMERRVKMKKGKLKGKNKMQEVGLKAIRGGGYTKQQNRGWGKYSCNRSGGGGSYGSQQK